MATGEDSIGSVAILLVMGGVLLGRYMTQSDSPKLQDRAALAPVEDPAAHAKQKSSLNGPSGSGGVDQPPVGGFSKGTPDGSTPRTSVDQALDAVATAPNFDAQIHAIRELGNYQDPRTLKVLGPALHSHVPAVRKAALDAMREGAVEDRTILAEVRNAVTSDADPDVKRAAFEVLIRWDESPEGRKVLEKLASEPSGPYREVARRELDRMAYEADARSRPDTQIQKVQQP